MLNLHSLLNMFLTDILGRKTLIIAIFHDIGVFMLIPIKNIYEVLRKWKVQQFEDRDKEKS